MDPEPNGSLTGRGAASDEVTTLDDKPLYFRRPTQLPAGVERWIAIQVRGWPWVFVRVRV